MSINKDQVKGRVEEAKGSIKEARSSAMRRWKQRATFKRTSARFKRRLVISSRT